MKPVNRMLNDKAIAAIEQKYKAKYVIDSCLKTKDGLWVNFPAAFFHTEDKHPVGSNYMALYSNPDNPGEWGVTNGICITEVEFNGILFEDGELIHSRYRHDYFEHRCSMVDGGRDYFRCSPNPENSRPIKFKVVGPDLVLCVV